MKKLFIIKILAQNHSMISFPSQFFLSFRFNVYHRRNLPLCLFLTYFFISQITLLKFILYLSELRLFYTHFPFFSFIYIEINHFLELYHTLNLLFRVSSLRMGLPRLKAICKQSGAL